MKATSREKYIRNNNIIEALQLTRETCEDVAGFIGKHFIRLYTPYCNYKDSLPIYSIETFNALESAYNTIVVNYGDYIIREQNGNISVIQKNTFKEEFQKIKMERIYDMKKLICPVCKTEIETPDEQQFKFCPNCGAKIGESKTPKEPTLGDCILSRYIKSESRDLYNNCIAIMENVIKQDANFICEYPNNKECREHLIAATDGLNTLSGIDSREFHNITKNKLAEILNMTTPSKLDLDSIIDEIKFQASSIKEGANKLNG